ncbi:hypothetical protein ACWDTI_05380 [Gordonia sp. NPDC003424]
MFELGPDATLAALASASTDELVASGGEWTLIERRAAARKIMAAHRVGQLMFERVLADCGHRSINNLPDKAAVREVAYRFHAHTITAGRWIGLGDLLHLVPKVLRAFLDGTLTETRARLIAERLAGLDPAKRDAAADTALDYAARPISGARLADLLDELIIDLDPALAAEQRDDFTATQQGVRFRKEAHGHITIDATVPLADGRFLQARIDEVI